MNLRRMFAFFRTPIGRLSLFLLLFFVFVSGGILRQKPKQTPAQEMAKKEGVTHATHSRFVREIPQLHPRKFYPTPSPEPASLYPPVEFIEQRKLTAQEVPEPRPEATPSPSPIAMGIYDATSDSESSSFLRATPYLPFGRLIRCELVNTVDTSNMLTPIIGLVTHDVWHNGELVIPEGTEVHGTAAKQPERERVGGDARWMFVFHDGRELKASGIALDHAPIPDEEAWEISDGSAGLRGSIVQTDRYAEIKAITAAMLAAAADGFTDKTQYMTQFGSIVTHKPPSWRNALSAGIERGTQLIAQRLLERGDPFFVRVPAGTTFYLYLTQTLLLHEATVAGSTPDASMKYPTYNSQPGS